MEGNFERDHSPLRRLPSTVTTIYHAHNSNVFKSSESSVQITSAVVGPTNGDDSKTSQNYCELDIVSRREKEKSVSTAVETTETKSGGVFRKTVCESDNKSGILCLANVVKDVDEEYCKPIILKTKDRDGRGKSPIGDLKDSKHKQLEDFFKYREYCIPNKLLNKDGSKETSEHMLNMESKSRSSSQKRRSKGRSPISKSVDRQSKLMNPGPNELSTSNQSSTDQIPMQFADIVQARTMYFVDLPNISSKKNKHKSKPHVYEKDDPKLGHIYVNKIEGEYPTMSCLDTESSIPVRLQRRGSFGSIITLKHKEKRHDNSPQPEEPFIKTKEVKSKVKHKKHKSYDTNMNQPEMSYDYIPCKEEKIDDAEIEVLYKKSNKEEKKSDGKRKSRKSKSKEDKEKIVKDQEKKDKDEIKTKQSNEIPKEKVIPGTSSKNLKAKDPSHKSRKSSPPYSKSYVCNDVDTKKCRMGSLNNHTKQDLAVKHKKHDSRRKHTKREVSKSDKKDKSVKDGIVKFNIPDDLNMGSPIIFLPESEMDNHFAKLIYNNKKIMGDICHPKGKDFNEKDGIVSKKNKKVDQKYIPEMISHTKCYDSSSINTHTQTSEFISTQTSTQPLIKKTQCVGAVIPVNHYMGYFLPPQVAERFSRKNSLPHYVIPERLRGSNSPESQQIPKMKRSRSCVPYKNTDAELVSTSKSEMITSRISSDTQMDTKLSIDSPHKKRSKSVVTKEEVAEIDKTTLATIESREHLEKELRKLHMIQHIDSRNRNKTELCKNARGNSRLKPKLLSKDEQDVILNLPICYSDNKSSTNSLTGSDVSAIRFNAILKKQNQLLPSPQEEPCHPEEGNFETKRRNSSPRREVSLSQLNLKPLPQLYPSPRTDVSVQREKTLSRSTIHSDFMSECTDFSAMKLNSITMILGEKIIEICNKMIDENGGIIEGYTVSGLEPPKKLKSCKSPTRNCKSNLQITYFPSTQIFNLDIQPKGVYTYGIFAQKNSKESNSSELSKSANGDSKRENIKSPVQVKTKKKLLPESIKKKNRKSSDVKMFKKCDSKTNNKISRSISNLFDASKSNEKIHAKVEIKHSKKNLLRQDVRSLSRINSAVKMMESSLQIIKEESLSSDSSAKSKKGISLTDIKQTQTDLVTNDLERMREVVNYLYMAFDQTGNFDQWRESKVNIKNDPSTTSSCCEHFKNMVKSVKPKFNTLRKLSKVEMTSSTGQISADGLTPKLSKSSAFRDTCAFSTQDSSGSLAKIGLGDPKFSQHLQNRESSTDNIRNLNYTTSKIVQSVPKLDKGISTDYKPEIKSSTSISDFSSLIVSIGESERVRLINEGIITQNEEKSIQCTLEGSKNSKSDFEISNLEWQNKFENKSLQTSTPQGVIKKDLSAGESGSSGFLKRRSNSTSSSSKRRYKRGLGKCKSEERKPKTIEVDYVNLLKLERHLEQVLGLYPTVCKAIRAHQKIGYSKDKKYFPSQDTLATIDTITEYNSIDGEKKSSDRFMRHRKFPIDKYLYANRIKFHNKNRSKYSLFSSSSKKLDIDVSTPYPYTDTSSSSSKLGNHIFRKDRTPRWYTRGRKYKRKWNYHDIQDNWSIGSPLYSISTPSLTHSKNYIQTRSKSLTTTQVFTSQLSTSKSLIEISSNKHLNRRAMVQKLQEDLTAKGSFHLGKKLFLILDSSPSSKLINRKLNGHNTERSISKIADISEPKMKINEMNCYNLLFSGNQMFKEATKPSNRPFFMHRQSSSSDFFDSIEKRKSEDEDLGNFSADSLDSCPVDDALNYTMKLLQNELEPKQNFFVYTSRVNYSSLYKDRSRSSSKSSSGKSTSSNSKKHKESSQKSDDSDKTSSKEISIIPDIKNTDDGSNTLISESGYETSNRTKPTVSIKNFFKKGGSLLDLFRHNNKSKSSNESNLTNFSSLYLNNFQNQSETASSECQTRSQFEDEQTSNSSKKVCWSSLAKRQSSQKKITFSEVKVGTGNNNSNMKGIRIGNNCQETKHVVESVNTSVNNSSDKNDFDTSESSSYSTNKECSDGNGNQYDNHITDQMIKKTNLTANKKCSVTTSKFEKEKCACHEYAEKVVNESQQKRDGYRKQLEDFEEIPLEILIGKKIPFASNKPIVQMHMNSELKQKSTDKPNSSRYPHYDSNSMLQDVKSFTFEDDKIIFQSSRTKLCCGLKPLSPSKGIQAKPLKPTCPDSCYSVDEIPPQCGKYTSKNKKKSCTSKVSFQKTVSDRFSLKQRRKPQSAPIGCRCDIDDVDPIPPEIDANEADLTHYKWGKRSKKRQLDSYKSAPEDGYQTENDISEKYFSDGMSTKAYRKLKCQCTNTEQHSVGTEAFLKGSTFKQKHAETQIGPCEAKGTQPELQKDDTSTRETYMDVKPFHAEEATEPMPSDRISTSVQGTQMYEESIERKPIKRQTQTPDLWELYFKDDDGKGIGIESKLKQDGVTVKSVESDRSAEVELASRPSRTVYTQIKPDSILAPLYRGVYDDSSEIKIDALQTATILKKPISDSSKEASVQELLAPKKYRPSELKLGRSAPVEFPAELKPSNENVVKQDSLNAAKVVDSLTVIHKVYETSKGKKSDSSLESVDTRTRAITISENLIVHEHDDELIGKMWSDTADLPKSIHSCASFIDGIMNEIAANAFSICLRNKVKRDDSREDDLALIDTELLTFPTVQKSLEDDLPNIQEYATSNHGLDEPRKGLTDKEVFDKLLTSFEKEDEIAVRLSKDETFFQEQINKLRKDSDESLPDQLMDKLADCDNIFADDLTDKHRSTHFWEEKMKSMRAKEDNPVKTDDIGTCFARGFRPDNIALSGDACFNLNKQDKIKFTKGMLTNEESIIDFSERETPLDYLLALGFMVDEASNALKDDDIRSRLLAAITEARVWINKITTTQGTLLYLVAYKSRPKTMRYFLQLVEAIINKRINNAIKLDGFLRVLEKVEEGEIQMINILGADKFEDEENEEKIVKKQLRQLFITVYKIAEKEAQQKGNELSQQAIVLLRILAAKYRAGLHPHLELIARYIGQDLLNTETQLEAAMIFLSRLDTAEVKLKEFEAYCDIKCEKRKRQMKQYEILDDQTDSSPAIQQPTTSLDNQLEDFDDHLNQMRKDKGPKKVTHQETD